jgi:hypothetical protein
MMSESDGKPYIHSFDVIGEKYANYCMKTLIRDINEFIQTQSDASLSMMLMAAMVKRLGKIADRTDQLCGLLRHQIDYPKQDDGRVERDNVADGMLLVLRTTAADVPIILCDQSELSARARRALRRGRFQFLSEVTQEAALDLKDCDMTTACELEGWKHLQYERFAGSNGMKSESLAKGGE